jgi:hypothetical protein
VPRRLDRLPCLALPGGWRVAVAHGPRARLLGLAGMAEPPAGWALLLPGCRSVHTFGMRFALDLVWLAPDGSPLRVDRAVGPGRVRACRGARAVVEVPARLGPPRSPRPPPSPAQGAVPPAVLASSTPGSSDASDGGWPSWPSSEASRPKISPTVQSISRRVRRLAPGIITRW